MVEDGEAQLVTAADALQAGLRGGVGFVDGLGAEIGQFGCFDVAPEEFDRVEFGGVAGKWFDVEPVPLGGQPCLHGAGAVGGQSVPDQRDRLAVEVVVQVGEELDQRFGL